MKAKGSSIKRSITVVIATVSMLLIGGSITAFAAPLNHDGFSGPAPAAPTVTTATGNAWIVAMIVALGVIALSLALIGTVRLYRSRTRAVAAS
jgi:hypothetical protein